VKRSHFNISSPQNQNAVDDGVDSATIISPARPKQAILLTSEIVMFEEIREWWWWCSVAVVVSG
jgi:hypothetical protein